MRREEGRQVWEEGVIRGTGDGERRDGQRREEGQVQQPRKDERSVKKTGDERRQVGKMIDESQRRTEHPLTPS